MLRSLHSPAVSFDLLALSGSAGALLVGRDSDAGIRMEAAEVPLLLSRKHAEFRISPQTGKVLLTDLNSTNGTYAARPGQQLQKLQPHAPWDVQEGDMLGFGGPDHVCSNAATIRNPFIFKVYPSSAMQARQAQQLADHQRDDVMQGDQEGADISYCAAGERETGTHVSGTAPLGRPGHARPRPGCRSDDCCSHSPDQDGRDAGTLRMGGKQPLPGTPGSQAMSNVLASHLSCAACQDWMVACHALSCGHMFCGTCLATCLERSNSCPSCRRANAGLPVRCFQIDNTINDLLAQGVALASPNAWRTRQAKQAQWEALQSAVVPAWASALQQRQERALESAGRFHRAYMAQEPFPSE